MVKGWTPREQKPLLYGAIVIFLVAIIALGGSWQANRELEHSNQQLQSYVRCQTVWNSFLHRVLEVRTNAGAEATAAMDELVNAITEAKSADDTRAALTKYKAAREKQLLTQQQNPLPLPPDEVCTI